MAQTGENEMFLHNYHLSWNKNYTEILKHSGKTVRTAPPDPAYYTSVNHYNRYISPSVYGRFVPLSPRNGISLFIRSWIYEMILG